MDQMNIKTSTAELPLSGLIGMASHPDTRKIWIIGYFFENGLHWQFAVQLLLFTVRTCVLKLLTTPDLKL
jgi:hypothetical protein